MKEVAYNRKWKVYFETFWSLLVLCAFHNAGVVFCCTYVLILCACYSCSYDGDLSVSWSNRYQVQICSVVLFACEDINLHTFYMYFLIQPAKCPGNNCKHECAHVNRFVRSFVSGLHAFQCRGLPTPQHVLREQGNGIDMPIFRLLGTVMTILRTKSHRRWGSRNRPSQTRISRENSCSSSALDSSR